MNKSLLQVAENEVQEERNKKAVEEYKILLREKANAEDLLKAIERKIEVVKDKLEG